MASTTKLDKAIALAQHELAALNAGDIEKAITLMDERKVVLEEAYAKHDEASHKDYIVKLIAMQSYNMQILEKGSALKSELRQSIKSSTKSVQASNKYMRAAL